MIAVDLAVCEWSPGSNRSMVDPVVAVARLDMPAPTRAVLVEKMRRHQFDDVVSIRWAGVTSDNGSHQYEAAIANMNFAAGRICRTVTRAKWSADHVEGAIVYIVDGQAFGYAAACGNLFELVLREGVAAPQVAAAVPAQIEFAAVPTIEVAEPTVAIGAYAVDLAREGGWGTGGAFGSASGVYSPAPAYAVPCPVVAVAEPETYALILAGLAVLALIKRKRA